MVVVFVSETQERDEAKHLLISISEKPAMTLRLDGERSGFY